MPNATESQIKARIAEFVQELELAVRKNTLDALKDALGGRAAPARRGRPPGSKRGSGRATDSAGLAAKIAAQVRSSPGQSVGEIVKGVGAKPAVVKKTIKAMLDAGELRKAGQKRGTRYYPPGAGRLPGAVAKKAKARKAKRRAAPKKAVIVPVRKGPAPSAVRETLVPQHLETSPAPARAGVA